MTTTTALSADPALPSTVEPFTVEPAATWDTAAYRGVCGECGDRTSKKGSERKAAAAIVDHLRNAHGYRP
ncbi:hypothetical protein [Nocardioides sp. Leaf285]|uniref:hypothetical protein n=1 Tax=Nocardioides sp. Leaf285 TaxID=1736322 RepID=UPI000702EC62|nr:hypothetical protein [Nocardioides sp. Leaf285]KQP62989.1 hypothetical protein ASF47_18430 [Nocardioides sp. Leaf285]